MSNSTKRLNTLIDEQQSLLNSIKAEAMAIDSEELSVQNERLKVELDLAEKKANQISKENDSLKNELSTTKSALFAKMANEKLAVFNSTQRKIENSYYRESYAVDSRLDEYEKNCRISLDATIKAIEGYGSAEFDDILNQLNALKQEAEARRERINEYKVEQIENAKATNFKIGNELKNEALTDVEKRTALKQKSLEAFIGLNVLSKAGILLFIVGIIMLGRYAYVHMSDVFKGGLIYLLGAVLIVVGELFYKKEKTIFSTTLISGGVATLYASSATCCFALNLYSEKVTFISCIVITMLAVLLSNQVKSQVVCAFGAVGGYLPVVALYMMSFGKVAVDKSFLPASSIYFCLLAVILFVMTYNKRWHTAQFIGYSLHLVAIGGVAGCAYAFRNMNGYGYALPLAIAFSVASFVIYLLMPSVKIIKRKPVSTADIVLLGLNTASGAISISLTVRNYLHNSAQMSLVIGLVFLILTVLYGVLTAFSIRSREQSSTATTAITSIGALVFSMLVIPLAFGLQYAGISWAIEGGLIAIISMQRGIKLPELSGFLCMLLSVFVSVIRLGELSQALIIITFSVVLSAFWFYAVFGIISAKAKDESNLLYVMVELLTAYSTAGYIYYLYRCIMQSPAITINSMFLNIAVAIVAVLVVSVVIRLGVLKNEASRVVSDLVGIALILVCLVMLNIRCDYNLVLSYFGTVIQPKKFIIACAILLVVINVLVELFFAFCVVDIINMAYASSWVFTLAISVSSLALITAVLVAQFGVAFSSVVISTVYIAVACIMLVIGFKRSYTVVRSGGLVLILCAFAKLCFIDTMHLDSSWKIASYFAFGAILIVISFFYQKFVKEKTGE